MGDEVEALVKESIDAVLENAPYKHDFVGQWTNDVVETCVKRLAGLGKPFKYVVRYYATEWSRPAHRGVVFLGQRHGREQDGSVGEPIAVRGGDRVWARVVMIL